MVRRPSIVAVALAFEGALLVLAWGLGAWLDAPALGRARFGAGAVALGVAGGGVLLVVLLPALRSEWPPFARLTETVRAFVREWFADASILDLAAVSAMAGIAEEALFRGVVQTALADLWGAVPAIVVAGILFGLAHAVTVTYAVVAAAVGMALGALLAATGDLAAPILAHAVYDLLALVWLTRVDPRGGAAESPSPPPPTPTGPSTPEGRTR